MLNTKAGAALFFIVFLLMAGKVVSQTSYTITHEHKNEDCEKGKADIYVLPNDSVTITWSSGQTGPSIDELVEGEYLAHIVRKNKLDTTITIKIEKEDCKIQAANHFTPNEDNYNDAWSIGYTTLYPSFELYVFNKWGQQVHSQKGTYTPWDGKWKGIDVPDGTYYYVFYYDPKKNNKLEKGDVTILR